MSSAEKIGETIAMYKKHGWELRRVLLSDQLRADLTDDLEELFGPAAVRSSEIDAAWFSRPPGADPVAWEIRYLGEPPYALVEVLDESAADLEQMIGAIESRLASAVAKGPGKGSK